jgi:hypothetical protein
MFFSYSAVVRDFGYTVVLYVWEPCLASMSTLSISVDDLLDRKVDKECLRVSASGIGVTEAEVDYEPELAGCSQRS